jgi:hypothetical protein
VRRRRAKLPSTRPAGRRSRRAATTAGVVASVLVLVGAPVVVLLLASEQDVTAEAPAVRPGSNDALRPATPFFRNAGDGVRPDGIGCTGPGGRVLRGRAHLDIFADRRRVTVPAGIGVLSTCSYWLRTTRDDGIVTIDSPERRAFTLGDLFDIWGAPLTRTQVLAFEVGPDRPVRVVVDGRRARGDPRAVRIADGREIALVIGRAPARVPSRFAFPSGG